MATTRSRKRSGAVDSPPDLSSFRRRRALTASTTTSIPEGRTGEGEGEGGSDGSPLKRTDSGLGLGARARATGGSIDSPRSARSARSDGSRMQMMARLAAAGRARSRSGAVSGGSSPVHRSRAASSTGRLQRPSLGGGAGPREQDSPLRDYDSLDSSQMGGASSSHGQSQSQGQSPMLRGTRSFTGRTGTSFGSEFDPAAHPEAESEREEENEDEWGSGSGASGPAIGGEGAPVAPLAGRLEIGTGAGSMGGGEEEGGIEDEMADIDGAVFSPAFGGALSSIERGAGDSPTGGREGGGGGVRGIGPGQGAGASFGFGPSGRGNLSDRESASEGAGSGSGSRGGEQLEGSKAVAGAGAESGSGGGSGSIGAAAAQQLVRGVRATVPGSGSSGGSDSENSGGAGHGAQPFVGVGGRLGRMELPSPAARLELSGVSAYEGDSDFEASASGAIEGGGAIVEAGADDARRQGAVRGPAGLEEAIKTTERPDDDDSLDDFDY